jgi:hypothetical protein
MRNAEKIPQLQLFQAPLLKVPQWETLPYKLRHQTVPLLARLLCEHHARRVAANHAKEVCDE